MLYQRRARGDSDAGKREHLGSSETEQETRTAVWCLAGQVAVRKRREDTSAGTGDKLFCALVAFEESALSLGCDKRA